MAEFVGLAASIAGLIQLTGAVATVGYGYVGAVRNAPKDIQNLCDELKELKNILIILKDYTNATNPQASAISELKTPVKRCILEMEDLRSKLEPRAGLRKIFHRLKWPLRAGETSQAISKIERHKSLFNLALTVDQHLLSKAIEVFARNTDMAVGDLLQSVQTEFAAQRLQRQKDDATRAGEKRMEVLNWLYQGSFDKKHTEISTKRQEHTGMWLLRTPEFQRWIKENPDIRLLWGHGIPGAGKTFLSSLVIDELETRASMTNDGVAHIYFNYKEQDQQMPINVVSSLIKQLATQNPKLNLPHEIEGLYDELSPKQKRPTLEKLKTALLPTLKLFTRVFFVFDALDECEENSQRKELLPLFHLLCDNGASIFLTSRPHLRDIRDSLSASTVTKIQLEAKEEDIRIYVEEKIKGNSHARNLIRDGFRDEIISTLVNCSNGMFLLVHFYIEDLCQYTTLKQVQTALHELKTSLRTARPLDGIYNRAIDSIRRQHRSREELALKVLSWLVKAKRTLTTDEICVAVSVKQNQYELCEGDIPDSGMLLEVCAGLVIIDENSNTIQLAHYSVQEYLVGNSVIPASANLELAITCTTFLSFDNFTQACESLDALELQRESHPFLRYAAPQLSHHLKACDNNIPVDILLKFLTNLDSLRFYRQACPYFPWYGFESQPEVSPLYEASYLGHYIAVHQLLEEGADISFQGRSGTALHAAAMEGHKAVVELLLKKGADISAQDSYKNTALIRAAYRGHEAVARLLLEKGADISAQDSGKNTALTSAASGGHEAVVRLLLEKGADISAQDSYKNTALTSAASRGYEAVVRLLLEKGADISTQNDIKMTALARAAYQGHEAVVRLLLEKGADISAQDSGKNTALTSAASRGHEAVVRLLLEKGADISTQNDIKMTALAEAAYQGHEAVVQLLLENGADISDRDIWNDTPLLDAASRGHEAVVRLLLEKGADTSAQNSTGQTALIKAASNGHEAVVRLLLEKGADPTVTDNDGSTAVSKAASQAIIDLLETALEHESK